MEKKRHNEENRQHEENTSSTSKKKRDMTSENGAQLHNFRNDYWSWSKKDKSHEVRLIGEKNKTARFHPNWSNGTAGVRGTRVLNKGRYYWEINVTQRIFGTSMMFGIGTKRARLHVDSFVNMLGEDEFGWGLSHKGLLWHNGKWRQYAKPFRENEATTVGLLFDGDRGTLAYYKDGNSLGVAFTDLHRVKDELYPIVCSTAAKTEMSLGVTKQEFSSLQDRCRSVIIRYLRNGADVRKLRVPKPIKSYLMDALDVPKYPHMSCKDAMQYNVHNSNCMKCLTKSVNDVRYLMV